MARTKDWMKLGALAGIAAVLLVTFAAVTDGPRLGFAQQPTHTTLVDRPAPVVTAPKAVADLGEAFTAVSQAVRPSVVYIESEARVQEQPQQRRQQPNLPPPFDQFFDLPNQDIAPQPRAGSGSGFIISPDGYIMTNNHVVDGFDRFTVQLFDHREFNATVVGRDPETDVAVIKINAKHLPAASFGDSDRLQVGQWVLAIGNPFGSDFSFTVTAGIVSGRGRPLRDLQKSQWAIQDFIQTDAVINPGNSGGPLVNINGQVVGMNSAIAGNPSGTWTGYSFAIPINLARTVAEQLIDNGKVTRAALGILVTDATALDAEAVGLDSVHGVLVEGFPEGPKSPAESAGLQAGDVIVSIDGKPVKYVAQLQQIVGFKKPGETVQVTVARADSTKKTIPVQLMAKGSADEPVVASNGGNDAHAERASESRLGFSVDVVDQQLAQQLDNSHEGVLVRSVDPNGPARNLLTAAIPQVGAFDIITHVNGKRVQTTEEFNAAVRNIKGGSIVTLQLWRIRRNGSGPAVIRLKAKAGTS